jgi:hypothetical protein
MNGISEQEIMQHTDHRSDTSDRKYKGSSEQLKVEVPKIVKPHQIKSVCLKSEDVEPAPKKKVKNSVFCRILPTNTRQFSQSVIFSFCF